MKPNRTTTPPARCIAPVDASDAGPNAFRERGVAELLCGEPATTERTAEGIVCPLCAAHAAELDEDRAKN